MSEKKTVSDDELNSVSGGNRQKARAGVGSSSILGARNRNTFGVTQHSRFGFGNESISQNKSTSISRNRNYLGQCEPEEDDNNSLQKSTCSDPANRGKKPECADCPAGIK